MVFAEPVLQTRQRFQSSVAFIVSQALVTLLGCFGRAPVALLIVEEGVPLFEELAHQTYLLADRALQQEAEILLVFGA
jgi:hypothetical protein